MSPGFQSGPFFYGMIFFNGMKMKIILSKLHHENSQLLSGCGFLFLTPFIIYLWVHNYTNFFNKNYIIASRVSTSSVLIFSYSS